jgi:hypothetical protein
LSRPAPDDSDTAAAPHQAGEESDVSTHGEKTAKTTGTVAPDVTVDKTTPAPEPTARTAAEIVAAAKNRAGKESAEKDAGEQESGDMATGEKVGAAAPTAKTTAVGRPATAKLVKAKPAADRATGKGRGKVAMSAVGSGVTRVRNLVATIVWLGAVLCAAVLALGALFTVLDQANESNEIVSWVLDRGRDLVGPFEDVFKLETAKNTLLVNWGIAALAYLIVGKLAERIIRP